MKRILFVMQSLYNGGAEKSLVNLLNELPEDKYHVDLLLFKKEGMFLAQVPAWVNILETPQTLRELFGSIRESHGTIFRKIGGTVISRIRKKRGSERAAWRWENAYKRAIPDLPSIYDVSIAYISGEVMYYLADKVNARKKIVWIHNDYRTAHHPKEYDYPYFKMMDGLVSISQTCVDILKEEFPEFSDKIYCIENITSSKVTRKRSQEFYPSEYQRDMPIILSIGRLTEQKGFDMAIEAAAMLRRRGVTFRWFIIGNGELKAQLQKQIEAKDLEDIVLLLGTRQNPYPYIVNCTVFAQSSRFEGKSVVLDEAKILCKPIVVTDYPTVHDQIEDGKEGMIVPMYAEGIADGIQKMLENEELRNRYSDYLKAHEYGNHDEVRMYIDLIEK